VVSKPSVCGVGERVLTLIDAGAMHAVLGTRHFGDRAALRGHRGGLLLRVVKSLLCLVKRIPCVVRAFYM